MHNAHPGGRKMEVLITLTRKRDGNSPGAGGLAGVVGVDAIAGGLIEGLDQAINVVGDLMAGEHAGKMRGAEVSGSSGCI